MKLILASVASLMFAGNVWAKSVATVTTSGGFLKSPTTTTLTLESDGTFSVKRVVSSWEKSVADEVTTVKVAKLNKIVVEAIVKEMTTLTTTAIVAEDPAGPECIDAPLTSFAALKDGDLIEIAQTKNCKSYSLDDFQGRTSLDILKSLLTIYRSVF